MALNIQERIKKSFEKIFSMGKYSFDSIILRKSVAEDIINFAESNAPREFVALLGGKIEAGKLMIDRIIYQNYVSSSNSAFFWRNFPSFPETMGSVHSHNSKNNMPSRADMRFFRENGFFHIIISEPFSGESMAGYSPYGKRIYFSIEE
ncbi:MAG: Mov34/MPN/PAD-1 family protein [Candidatus Woesearchaeota archaeon]|nr:Mov34/MPN/PAD-1 family protein [Candidatus Woesearchaeota archaeon]